MSAASRAPSSKSHEAVRFSSAGHDRRQRAPSLIGELNADAAVHGILVQLPLPPQIDASRIIAAVDPAKDIDGFHRSMPAGWPRDCRRWRPCTPVGCIKLARWWHASLSGLDAVVIGRSNIVGKPLVQLLLARTRQ